MSIQDIINAWRARDARESLTEEEQTFLPENPIGEVLNDEDLLSISGGMITFPGDTVTHGTNCI